MSEVRLNIMDAGRVIHGTTHGSDIDRIVASLAADPTTIEELENAMARFIKPMDGMKPFALFKPGANEEPYDAGISFVDLEARVVASESTYSFPGAYGSVYYHDGTKQTNASIPYCVSSDWLLLSSIDEYMCVRDLRRVQNATSPPLDARASLYGAISEYIVRECLAARASGEKDPVREIHARWLMTPRDDLRGQSPRAVLLARREFIEADLHSREHQWSLLGEPPPCLDPQSAAYKFGGFGTHEIVVYYHLVRFLISKCWKRINKRHSTSLTDEFSRLQRLQSRWLAHPEKDFENRSAAFVIDCERKRLPLAVSPEEGLIDEDCPFCRAMAGHTGPSFWHLDGSGMDNDFAYSLFLTREEWENEQCLMAEYEKEFEAKREEQQTLSKESCPHDHGTVH